MQGVFPHPDVSDMMPVTRFNAIKSCYAAAFACDWNHVVKEGEEWSPVPEETPGSDEWAKIQGLVNDFNSAVRRNFSASDKICMDESMSPFRPHQSQRANLPHLSYILRKPKTLGTEYKCVTCSDSGIILKLEIQRGKVSTHLIQLILWNSLSQPIPFDLILY